MRILLFTLAIGVILLGACAGPSAPPAPTAPIEPSTSVVELPPPESTTEAAPVSRLSYVVVDTGQEKCYDNSREITCPQPHESFYGQDA